MMSLNSNNISEIKESFDHLLKRNDEVQDDVKTALKSGDYANAAKVIHTYVKLVDGFIQKTLSIAQKFGDKANFGNQAICLKAVKMAEEIITAHLEVERNILKEYKKDEQ